MGGTTTKQDGFSLIELLTVIAIIAVLSGIIFPLASSMRERSNQTSCLTNLQSIGQGLKLYRLDERAYPPALYGYQVEGDLAPTTFLYPQYARSRREFKCPDNPNRFDETRLGGWYEGSALPNAVPQKRVAKKGGGYDVQATTDKKIAYFLFDSYDGGMIYPARRYDGAMAPPYSGSNTPAFELHYRTDWGHFGACDTDREMLERNPEDGTFVTACTYHRRYDGNGNLKRGSDSWDMVLFLDGHTEKVPSDQVSPKLEP